MLRFSVATIAIAALSATSSAQAPSLTLDCMSPLRGSESLALRQAPTGATRISTGRLSVKWSGGTRVFQDSGRVAGSNEGLGYTYCGYNAAAGLHLISRIDKGTSTGVLMKQSTGELLPAGELVMFAPDLKRYFAAVQLDGMEGEEWFLYSIEGVQLWKGPSGVVWKRWITPLDNPRWSASSELQATLRCALDPHPHDIVVTLRGAGKSFDWDPAVVCPVR